MKDFAIFILSHNRSDNVVTIESLKKCGYTGDYYIVIDDEDKTADDYYKKFGEKVIKFSKQEYIKKIDSGDNFNDYRAVVYARNACFDIAKKLGLKYFMELDDDYPMFEHRKKSGQVLKHCKVTKLDDIFNCMLEYLINAKLDSIALAQGGDFIGGLGSEMYTNRTKRKIMNAMIFKTSNPIKFLGKINEDTTAYTFFGSLGKKFITIADASLVQYNTQSQKGGLTEIYLNLGTYVKSFYSLMYMPSAVKIRAMGFSHPRLHHSIRWDNCVPKIISDVYKKN